MPSSIGRRNAGKILILSASDPERPVRPLWIEAFPKSSHHFMMPAPGRAAGDFTYAISACEYEMASASGIIRLLVLCISICILGAVCALTVACTAELDTHGDHVEAGRLAQIRPGVQTREDVAQILGSPSSRSVFDDERWYYISDVVETRSIFEREVKERQVVTIRFDRQGVVSGVDDFGLERGREVDLVARETPSFGESVGFLSQVMGNLGRFNNAGSVQQRRGGSPSPYGHP